MGTRRSWTLNVELILTRVGGPPATDDEIRDALNTKMMGGTVLTDRSTYQVLSVRHIDPEAGP